MCKGKRVFILLTLLAALMAALAVAAAAEGDGLTTYRATLIGVDNYSTNALTGCVTDANRVAAMLQASNEAGESYAADNVTVRTNLTSADIQALLDGMAAQGADDDDVTLFYFSGHGYINNNNVAGIVGKDGKSVSLSSARQYLDKVAGTKIVVIDARYLDGLLSSGAPEQTLTDYNNSVCSVFADGGYYVFTSAAQMSCEQKAAAQMTEPCGMTSLYLAQACGYDYLEQRPVDLAADINGNGAVSFVEARDYVAEKLTALGGEDGSYLYNVKVYPENGTFPLAARRGSIEILGISFDRDDMQLATGRASQLTVVTQPVNASARSITWTCSDLSVANVSASGSVTGLKPGTARVMATAPNGLSAAMEISVADVTFVESVALDWERLIVAPGTTTQITAAIEPAAATEGVVWASSDESVAMVDQTGAVTSIGIGLCTISCQSEGGVSAECSVQVVDADKAVSAVAVQEKTATLYAGEAQTVNFKVTPASALDTSVRVVSTDESIVRSADTNRLVANAAGTAVVRLVASSGVYVEMQVTVKSPTIRMNKKEVKLKETTGTGTLAVTVTPATLANQVTWVSADENVVKVDQGGKLTAGTVGQTTVTATAPGGATAECTVTVTGVDVTAIALDSKGKKITVNETFKLTATLKPDNASLKSIKWTSSNEAVATVSDTGDVTARAAGKTVITATSHNGKKAVCKLQVTPIAVTELTLNETSVTLISGMDGQNTVQLEASTQPVEAGNGSLSWISSNKKVATVNANGLVTAVGKGTATIRAMSLSNKKIHADVAVKVETNNAIYKTPVFDKNTYGLYTSAKKIGYIKQELWVQLFFYNYSSKPVAAPQAGTLVLTLADGTEIELREVPAGKKKLSSKKLGSQTYHFSVTERPELAGLDLRGATCTIVVADAGLTAPVPTDTPEEQPAETPPEEQLQAPEEDPLDGNI